MKKQSLTCGSHAGEYVVGSAAPKQDAAIGQVRSARIVAFPGSASSEEAQACSCGLGNGAHRASALQDLASRMSGKLQASPMVNDLLSGDLAGKPLGNASFLQSLGAGTVYAAIALCALYFGS